MNKLSNEISPYLLQHANNPVDWFPWRDEAFEKAEKENKPVFLSIGYSTCHWCHVMAKECFEDLEIANLLNKYFVSIKVDREERPDIDSIYMNVCQLMTGSGGWPLTVFLTADQNPFYAGTYFPKYSQYSRIGLLDLLTSIAKIWKDDRNKLFANSDKIITVLKNQHTENKKSDVVNDTLNYLNSNFDDKFGGFGNAPKFPMPNNLLFLLKYYEISNDKSALIMVEKSLLAMAKGGIFDQIGYGFSRYSTDRFWLVPHFEKMLYDNAQLISVYLECYKITKKEYYKNIAVRCIDYVLRDLTNENGAFYSAEDADSEGHEGLFYLFSKAEIINILGKEKGEKFCINFDITEKGNFEFKNIPNQIKNSDLLFEPFCEKLYNYRKARHNLHRDDKILTVWNCLMISALCKANKILGDDKYLKIAYKTLKFLENNLIKGDCIYTSWRKGINSENGVFDDYAFFISACIDYYKVTLDTTFIDKAIYFTQVAQKEFFDKNGGYFLTKLSAKKLIVRPKEIYDGVIPSGNSVMAKNLHFLSAFTEDLKFIDLAKKQFDYLSCQNLKGGQSYFAYTVLQKENFSKIIVSTVMPAEINKSKIIDFDLIKIISSCKEYPLISNKTTYYICKGNVCLPPKTTL